MSQLEQADVRVHPPAEEPFGENPATTNSDEGAINPGGAHGLNENKISHR